MVRASPRKTPSSSSCGCARSPAAARSAFSSTAPASGGSRNVPASDPSSSIRQASRRRTRAAASSAWLTRRWARANRSSWFPVIGPAISASPLSFSAVAIRVSARTLAYDSRPAPNPARITGRSRSARATRTCSRAAPADIWHFQDSHSAQLRMSQDAQPRRASKSPSKIRNRQVAAARCPASSQICASSRSSGTALSAAGLEILVSNMNLILVAGSDILMAPARQPPPIHLSHKSMIVRRLYSRHTFPRIPPGSGRLPLDHRLGLAARGAAYIDAASFLIRAMAAARLP